MTESDELRQGLIVRSEGGFHTVQFDGRRLLCTLAKRARRGERFATNPLAIGDGVRARDLGGEQGVIEEILPRRNALIRTAPGRDALAHVLVANLDLILVVFSLDEPPPNLARLDRFLVIAEQAEIPALIVVSKIDLGDPSEAERLYQPYRDAGYGFLLTSATTGHGTDAARAAITGRVSAVIGSSGVGKSTLLNSIQPGLRLRAGDVNERTGKGRHTTSVATLLALDGGGYVADTPGLRGIEPYELDPELLADYFPELRPLIGTCRFAPCSHLHEPGCAVRDAVASGNVALSRYDSYVKLYEEARATARRRGYARAR